MVFEKRRSGILLHPTSLPSRYGIGDFGENARMFIDILEKADKHSGRYYHFAPLAVEILLIKVHRHLQEIYC